MIFIYRTCHSFLHVRAMFAENCVSKPDQRHYLYLYGMKYCYHYNSITNQLLK